MRVDTCTAALSRVLSRARDPLGPHLPTRACAGGLAITFAACRTNMNKKNKKHAGWVLYTYGKGFGVTTPSRFSARNGLSTPNRGCDRGRRAPAVLFDCSDLRSGSVGTGEPLSRRSNAGTGAVSRRNALRTLESGVRYTDLAVSQAVPLQVLGLYSRWTMTSPLSPQHARPQSGWGAWRRWQQCKLGQLIYRQELHGQRRVSPSTWASLGVK